MIISTRIKCFPDTFFSISRVYKYLDVPNSKNRLLLPSSSLHSLLVRRKFSLIAYFNDRSDKYAV